MPKRYLSTDPNAGLDGGGNGDGRYLSTDPNAGDNDHGAPSSRGSNAAGAGLVVGAGMVAAPGLVAGANAAARGVARVMPALGPLVTTAAVVDDVRRGNYRQAAYDATAGTVASRMLPRVTKPVIAAVERATAPAGMLSRLGSAASRFAGPVGLAVETIFGEGAAGHRPAGETPERSAQRNLDFARAFKEQVNREAGREIIVGDTADEIIASIAAYRQRR